jgi:hypothetical protein
VKSEYNLRMGNAVVSLRFSRRRESLAMAEYFGRPSFHGAGDIALEIKFERTRAQRADVPNSLFLTKTGDGDGFAAAEGLIAGRFSPRSGEGELVIQSILMEGGYKRIFEQILYQAYWSAARRKGLDSLLLHSSCMIRDGKGYVFTGKSGSGKSTVASLNDGAKVLNDEISIIELGPASPTLHDSPFNGFFLEKKEGFAPLAGIYLLIQAPFHRVSAARGADTIKTLSREIIPPMGLETPLSPKVYWEMLELASRTADRVSLCNLEFLPDTGFWKTILASEKST